MSSSQQHTTDHAQQNIAAASDAPMIATDSDLNTNQDELAGRSSLSIADLAALAASTNSSTVFVQNAVRSLRFELNADAVLILDYVDAFGGKTVRATSGIDSAAIGSEVWLPDGLSPVDVNSPIKLVDVDPSLFNSISAIGALGQYRSAIALAVPAITGAAGMLIALVESPIDFEDAQIETAKTIVSLLSLTASRSNALTVAERGESQLATSRLITRSIAPDPESENNSLKPKSLLHKISDLLEPFFEFDVIAVRSQLDGEFVTQEVLHRNSSKDHAQHVVPLCRNPRWVTDQLNSVQLILVLR